MAKRAGFTGRLATFGSKSALGTGPALQTFGAVCKAPFRTALAGRGAGGLARLLAFGAGQALVVLAEVTLGTDHTFVVINVVAW